MYVKKFSADTLDEALKSVKRELGPEAIILKTITNKGLKGTFKKKKIEITAAISERDYTRKSNVDSVLNSDEQDSLYQDRAENVANTIEKYNSENSPTNSSEKSNHPSGYGKLGLNKAVQKVPETRKDLDEFLREDNFVVKEDRVDYRDKSKTDAKKNNIESYIKPDNDERNDGNSTNKIFTEFKEHRKRISELEDELEELKDQISKVSSLEHEGLTNLRAHLNGLQIDKKFIQLIVKKALFELNNDDLSDCDSVFDFTLREMSKVIKTNGPLFAHTELKGKPVITILLSESSCGQRNMILKMGDLKKKSIYLYYGDEQNNKYKISSAFLGLDVKYCETFSHLVVELKKAQEQGLSTFVDFKSKVDTHDDSKKLITGLSRSFDNIESLICISAIHNYQYNNKVLRKFNDISSGIVMTNLDLCIDYGSIFNLAYAFQELPFIFFGTGPVIPRDLEAASQERILSGLFSLDKSP